MSMPLAPHSLLLYDATQRQWQWFQQPLQVLAATRPSQVMPLLETVQQAVDHGYYAAGLLSYEASPAFDPGFAVRPCTDFPLAWFGLYTAPQRVRLEDFAIPDFANPGKDSLHWTPDIARDRYQQSIHQIKAAIAQGLTYQVNYSLRLRSPFTADPFAYFTQLIQAQPAQYGAFVDLGDWVICCASPELFFQWQNGELHCRPMKGTAARGLSYGDDRAIAQSLRHSAKNQAENVMIVDMIRNDLGRIATTGSVQVPRLFDLEQYPTLWQMTSPVQCHTAAALPEIFRALFPCASITGAPKHSTLKIIADLETSPRRIYTGSIGFITPQRRAQFNVAIRTVLIDKAPGTAEYGVGGGIVWDSEAEDEYAECCTKAEILTRSRPHFDLLESLLWEPEIGYFLLDLHLQRLQQSADYFGFSVNILAIQTDLQRWAQSHQWTTPQKVRLTVSPVGIWQQQAIALALPAGSQSLRVGISPVPVDTNNVFLYHKTTHRQVYERSRALADAQNQGSSPGYDDILLWNQRCEVTESCIGNFIAEIDGELYTPPVSSGLLAGTYRQWLLQQGKVQERIIYLDDLPRCRRLFLANSVRKLREVNLVGRLSACERY